MTTNHRNIAIALAFVSIAISAIAMAGWFFDIPVFYSFGIAEATMKFNTALLTLILGAGIILFLRRRATLASVPLAIVAIICVVTVIEYLFHLNWNFDQLFVIDSYTDGTKQAPGRISLPAIINYLLLVAALCAFRLKKYSLTQLLGFIAVLQMFVSVMGLLFGVSKLYYFGVFSAVSLPTSLSAMLLGMSIVLLQSSEGWFKIAFSEHAAGVAVRFALVYFLVAAPVFVAVYIYMFQGLDYAQKTDIIFVFLGLIIVSMPLVFILANRLENVDQELRQRNDDLQKLTGELAESNRLVGIQNRELANNNEDLINILHIISHDVKTPVTSLQTSLDLLKKKYARDDMPDAFRMLQIAISSADRLKTLISSLSELIRAGSFQPAHDERINLAELIDSIKTQFAKEISIADASFEVYMEEESVMYDRVALQSILHNLISNALKYRSPEREPVISIRFTKAPEGTSLMIFDNGLGIPETRIQETFGIYNRFHSHIEGAGVGLHLVKRLVERNGGEIKVASVEGAGTTFTIAFNKDIFVPESVPATR